METKFDVGEILMALDHQDFIRVQGIQVNKHGDVLYTCNSISYSEEQLLRPPHTMDFIIGDTCYLKGFFNKYELEVVGIDVNHRPNSGYDVRYTVKHKGSDYIESDIPAELLSKEPDIFERERLNQGDQYHYIDSIDNVMTGLEVHWPNNDANFNRFNYFTDVNEAVYVRDMMKPKLLRAIWQWKYWNDNNMGLYTIGVQYGETTVIEIENDEPIQPTFTSKQKAEACIEYLRNEGLLK